MSNIKLYRLLSGDEVLAEEVSSDQNNVTIKDAVVLVYHQTEKGSMSVGFAPFMPYGEGDITLTAGSIAAVAAPKEQIRNEHTRIFSGIVVASAGAIKT